MRKITHKFYALVQSMFLAGTDGLDPIEASRIGLINKVVFTGQLLMLSYGAIYYFLEFYYAAAADFIGAFSLFSIVYLNHLKRFDLAKIVGLTIASILIMLFVYFFSMDTLVYLVFIPVGSMPFLLIHRSQVRLRCIAAAIPLLFFCLGIGFKPETPIYVISDHLIDLLAVGSFFVTYFLCQLQFLVFDHSMTDYGVQFEALNKSLRKEISENNLLNELLDGSSLMVTIVDIDQGGRIIHVNDTILSILGYDRETMLQNTPEIFEKNFRMKSQEDWEGLYQNLKNGPQIFEAVFRTKSGDEFPIAGHVTINPDSENRLVLGTFRDITEESIAKDTIQTQHSILVSQSRIAELGKLTANISHEIKNPLTIVKGNFELYSSAVKKIAPNSEAFEKFEMRIGDGMDRIVKIVDGMRVIARDGSRETPHNVNAKSMIERFTDSITQTLAVKGITLEVAVAEGTVIFCRETQISQVIMNIVNNAIDAIEESGERGWIKISSWQELNNRYISILNSGARIQLDENDLFKPFFTTKEVGHGTGLGLSISKSLMQEHGGDLYLNQSNLIHTEFIIRFDETWESKQAS